MGKRISRWTHLQLQKIKLNKHFRSLIQERPGTLEIEIEDTITTGPDSGGFVIKMRGDSWRMGNFIGTILNESRGHRKAAIENLIKEDWGDSLLINTGVNTEIDVLDYSFGGRPVSIGG